MPDDMPRADTARSTVARTDPGLLAAARGDAPCDVAFVGGRVLNVFTGEIDAATVGVFGGRIACVLPADAGGVNARESVDVADGVIAPGLLDAHMHVESTMLPPSRFAELALPRGTVGAVFDPHEIANVCGSAGIRWIADDLRRCPLEAMLALSSCVPSSPLEASGAELDAEALRELFDDPDIGPRVVALAEMMNFPGVVNADAGVLAKLDLGLCRRIVDGHAPGLSGRALQAYVAAGVSSDHECTSAAEAREKLALGQRVFIREGSAAKNLAALLPLVTPANAHRFCFCTDDRHPGDLRSEGHIDHVVRSAVGLGLDPVIAWRLGSTNVAEHYRQPDLGAIAPGRLASFVIVDDLAQASVRETYARGVLVARGGAAVWRAAELSEWPDSGVTLPEGFGPEKLRIADPGTARIRVIGMHPDQLVTDALEREPTVVGGAAVADAERDLLKLAVIERHRGSGRIGLGFVENFRFRGGALASTVGHDAHNLAVVGDNDADMALAARTLAEVGGGQCVVARGRVLAVLALPIAGLMSDREPGDVIDAQHAVLAAARELGCPHADPFMPLSFLVLPVIPALKLTDLGLVDVTRFAVTGLGIDGGDA